GLEGGEDLGMETRAEGLYQCGEAGDKLIHRADLRAVRDPVVLEHPSGYRHSARWSARFSTSTTPVKVRNSSLRRTSSGLRPRSGAASEDVPAPRSFPLPALCRTWGTSPA